MIYLVSRSGGVDSPSNSYSHRSEVKGMKSYIKIYGPPFLKAIKALEKIAVEMPEVSIWNTLIELNPVFMTTEFDEETYFDSLGEIPEERRGKIISKSGEMIGAYDFYFEWFKDPEMEDLNNLIEKIDNALGPLRCRYTITTK